MLKSEPFRSLQEFLTKCAGIMRPVFRFLLESVQYNLLERRRDRRDELAGPAWRLSRMSHGDREWGQPAKRYGPRQHLVENHTHAVDIRGRSQRTAIALLWGHVTRRANHRSNLSQCLAIFFVQRISREFRDAEIQNFDHAGNV